MGVTEVVTRTYECDRCHAQQGKPFQRRGQARLSFALHDYQGAAVAARTIELPVLCDPCTGILEAVVLNPDIFTTEAVEDVAVAHRTQEPTA